MFRKIVYIFLGCLFFIHVNAQQEKVSPLLSKIKANLALLLGDGALAESCKKGIHALQQKLPYGDAKLLTPENIKALLNAGKEFIAFSLDDPGRNCNNVRIDSLLVTTKQLVKELDILKNVKPAQKDTLVKITIVLIDSLNKKVVSGKLSIDSLGKSITRFKAGKDSIGLYDVFLALNKRYVISVKARNYPISRKELILKTGDNPVITFQIRDTTVQKTASNPEVIKPPPAAVPPIVVTPATVSENRSFLYLAVFLFILLLFVSILYFNVFNRSRKKSKGNIFKSIVNPLAVFQKEINQKDSYIHEIHRNLEVVESSFADLTQKQKAMDSEPAKVEPVEIKPAATLETTPVKLVETIPAEMEKTALPETRETGSGHFICEIMMTAGPRKKFMNDPNPDKDLGEDVCGFIATPDEVLVWLLDGTSDTHCLINPDTNREYFSSRLLGQCIAEKLRSYFGQKPSAPLDYMTEQAAQSVSADWLKVVNELPEAEKLRLRTSIGRHNIPECTATLLLSRLLINGDYEGYRVGDSKLHLFKSTTKNEISFVETSFAIRPRINDRIVFRIQLDEEEKFYVDIIKPVFEIINEKNVTLAVSFSDGIGEESEQALKEKFKNAPGEIRHQIISQVQGTADDKSICFLEIRRY